MGFKIKDGVTSIDMPSLDKPFWVRPTSRSRMELEIVSGNGIAIATVTAHPDYEHEDVAKAVVMSLNFFVGS